MKSALRAFKNEWNDYCEGERIVRELTYNGDKEPSTEVLNELVYLLQTEPENYQRTFLMIMRRVTDYKYWRHVEKGLITVEHLLKYGNTRFVGSCKPHLSHFQKLQTYRYQLKEKEYGENIRRLAAEITRLLADNKALKIARSRAQHAPRKLFCSVEIYPAYQIESEQKDRDDMKSRKSRTQLKKTQSQKELKPKRKKPSRISQDQSIPTEEIDTTANSWLNLATHNEEVGIGDDGGVFAFDAIEVRDNNNASQTEENTLEAIGSNQSYENNPFSLSTNSNEHPNIDNLTPMYGISSTVSPSLNTSAHSSNDFSSQEL